MSNVETLRAVPAAGRLNVTDRLAAAARILPDSIAVACPAKWSPAYARVRRGNSTTTYATTTFAALDADATRIARGLAAWGVPAGTRLALLVRPGIDFVALVFGLLRAGMVIVLVDPGLGRKNLVRCLAEAQPEGFVAIGIAQASRLWLRRKFPRARWNVTVGRRWFWGGLTLHQLRALAAEDCLDESRDSTGAPGCTGRAPATSLGRGDGGVRTTTADDPAAIIFTSGSTGPPKGVLYTQRMFDTQVAEIQRAYAIQPGGVDLACFPLFALFNSAMGVTTVLPEMDFSRPASANPQTLVATANDWQVTQAFASPAVWRVLGAHCAKTSARIPSLKQVFSCGAPVTADVLRATLSFVGAGAKMHTPYGMTESLPVATIEAAEVLGETAARADSGAGICVGRKFDSIDWQIIRITDAPIESIDDAEGLPQGEIGELIVRGPQVSARYVTQTGHNATAKITVERAGPSTAPIGGEDAPARSDNSVERNIWHRTGDVGYFDDQHRFWYCGRKSHRIKSKSVELFSECIEGVFNAHPDVKQSALVGIGEAGEEVPVVAILRKSTRHARSSVFHGYQPDDVGNRACQLSSNLPLASPIRGIVHLPSFPVDVRHNSKILRELLHDWVVRAIIDDIDLYPADVSQRALLDRRRIDATPPFSNLS